MSRPLRYLLVAYLIALALARVTIAAPERCDAPSPDRIREAAADAAQWAAANQGGDGTFVYEQDRDGRSLGGYNEVRHAGVTTALYQAAAALDDGALLDHGDRALDWMRAHLGGRDDWQTLTVSGWASLGAGALMLTALEERREIDGSDQRDGLMRSIGRFLVAMQRDDGGFHVGADVATGDPDTDGTSPYYPGEALWALARLDALFPDDGFGDAARRAAHFIAGKRDDVEDVRFPPLNDHWASYGFAEMGKRERLDDDVVEYARPVSFRFDLLIRSEAQRDAGALYALTHGPARRAAALGTWVEGQAALGRLAGEDDRLSGLEEEITDRAACGAAVLVDRQNDDGPTSTHGAWFVGGVTRMDDQQHAISGLLAVADLLEARGNGR
ncbi:MAG: hypothetical protein M5T61_12245 [Acidimicrobiia bacterium]|nr:hypothetical protein [Acidimicrobiia bacterium]